MKKIVLSLCCIGIGFASYAQTANTLTPELLWKMGRVAEPQVSPDGSTVLFSITYYDLAENKGNTDLYTIPAIGGTPKKITETKASESDAHWLPGNSKRISFLSAETGENQLYEMNADGSQKVAVSAIKDGINGYLYSPKGKFIVYSKSVKTEQTVADIYPDLPKANARIIEGEMYRHWNVWDDYSNAHLFISTIANGKIVDGKDIMQGEHFDAPIEPFGGMDQVAISADEQTIAYSCKKLSGTADALSTNTDIYSYSIATGVCTNLSEGNMGYDNTPKFSPDGKSITWLQMRTPQFEADKSRLILHDIATNTNKDLTASLDQNVDDYQWTIDGKSILFISGIKATYQLYNIELTTAKIKQVTSGLHDYHQLNVGNNVVYMTKTTMSQPAEIEKINLGTGKVEQLTAINKSILSSLKFGKVENRTITATDGKPLQMWIIYPPDFDATKKYPALLYCQGGPQSVISQSFSYRWNFQLMAANGYIVIAPNRRGLPTFGQEWNDKISGDWGGQAIADYLTATDSMAAQPFVDKARIGAVGASYGGYSVYYLAGNHNGRFKTFIAHCGLFNLESWYTATDELFFAQHDIGKPYWEKKEGFNKFSPHNFVKNWDTPILVIHNEKDFRVPIGEGMQAFGVAQMKGLKSKFLYFPEEGHWVTKPQNSVLWNRVFFSWLKETL